MKSRTTGRATSASSSARRTSRSASLTSASLSAPRPRSRSKMPESLPERVSNTGAVPNESAPVREPSRTGGKGQAYGRRPVTSSRKPAGALAAPPDARRGHGIVRLAIAAGREGTGVCASAIRAQSQLSAPRLSSARRLPRHRPRCRGRAGAGADHARAERQRVRQQHHGQHQLRLRRQSRLRRLLGGRGHGKRLHAAARAHVPARRRRRHAARSGADPVRRLQFPRHRAERPGDQHQSAVDRRGAGRRVRDCAAGQDPAETLRARRHGPYLRRQQRQSQRLDLYVRRPRDASLADRALHAHRRRRLPLRR